jgi:hypothetical protein
MTDVTSLGTAEELLYEGLPTTVMGYQAELVTGRNGAWIHRCPIRFVMPTISGTITQVILYQKVLGVTGTPGNARVHQLLRTDWVEGQATWNIYKTSNNWSTAGAAGAGTDYSSTVIDEVAVPSTGNWQALYLMGGTSDNPLALTSGQTIDLIIRNATESGTNYTQYYGRTGDSNGHYLEVTYTAASSGSGLMLGGD